jgi:hypothetical protein
MPLRLPRAQVSRYTYEICDVQSGTGTGFSPILSALSVNIIPLLLHIHSCYYLGVGNRPVICSVSQGYSFSPSRYYDPRGKHRDRLDSNERNFDQEE